MDLHFVDTANVFGVLPVLEKGEVRARALRPWGVRRVRSMAYSLCN